MSPTCKFSYPVASKMQTDKPQLQYDILISLWNCHLLASLSHLKQKAVWSIFWFSSLSVLPRKVLTFSKHLNLILYQYSLENNHIQGHITFNSSWYWHNIKTERLEFLLNFHWPKTLFRKRGSLSLSLLEFKVFEGFVPQRFHCFPLFPHSELKHKNPKSRLKKPTPYFAGIIISLRQ